MFYHYIVQDLDLKWEQDRGDDLTDPEYERIFVSNIKLKLKDTKENNLWEPDCA